MTARTWLTLLAGLVSLVGGPSAAQADIAPGLGRFLQRDPNAMGQPVLSDQTWFHGRTPSLSLPAPNLQQHFGNGTNTYQYLGGNPLTRFDPMGLSYDPFEDAYAIAAEHVFSGYVAVEQARGAAKEGQHGIAAYSKAGWDFVDAVWDRDEAPLFGLVTGPVLSQACFEAGTPVLLADGSTQPIESLTLGSTVFSTADPAARPTHSHVATAFNTADPDAHDTIDPAAWRVVGLRLDDPTRGHVRVALLRPLAWLQATGAVEGGAFPLHLPEMGVQGAATVAAIRPCPDIAAAMPGAQIVTGTFTTERAGTVRVWLESGPTPIGSTASHPFYSIDRNGWVPAGSLRAGERVRALGGSVCVLRVDPCPTPTAVYNLEVRRTHTYYVGEARVWVHNACDANNIHHIFDKSGRKLQALERAFAGNRLAAFEAVEQAAQASARAGRFAQGGVATLSVTVRGVIVSVKGKIVNGVFRVGSFW